MGPRGRKRARSSDSVSKVQSAKHDSVPSAAHRDCAPNMDLWLDMPRMVSATGTTTILRRLIDRLESTGYTHAALTHIVYGRPGVDNDLAPTALPSTLWEPPVSASDCKASGKQQGKPRLRILRRLHAVVENLSDVGFYAKKDDPVLQSYDLVSMAPRNDEAFQAACSTATACEIITLDYTAGRSGLPFKVRATDLKAAVARQAVLEIPYTPAVLNRNYRKALIHACRQIQMASLGLQPRILLSSGDRRVENNDVAALALRTPGDLENLVLAVLRFEGRVATNALTYAAMFAVEQGERRRFGSTAVADVSWSSGLSTKDIPEGTNSKSIAATEPPAMEPTQEKEEPTKADLDNEDDKVVEDGFLAL